MNAVELIHEAIRLGLRFYPKGDKMRVGPANLCPPDFADKLRAHKPEILALLATDAARQARERVGWLHIARQVLSGGFNGANGSTTKSLVIGLRGVDHPDCRRAVDRLGVSGKKRSK